MKGFKPSLLEKLFDDDPGNTQHGRFKRHTLEQFKESVALDVEDLLNSRFVMDLEILAGFEQLEKSVITFGLRDFSHLSMASSEDRATICKALTLAIESHEPRLKNVTVSMDQRRRSVGGLRFSISAILVVYPAREHVSFDAFLQPSTLQYRVSKPRNISASN